MMAFSIEQTQRKVRTLGVALLVAAAALGMITVAPILGGGSSGPATALYNVTFMSMNGSAPGASGSAGFLSSADVPITIDQPNLTLVTFHISYTDNSISPLFNPAVTATIVGPDGSGGGQGSVSPGQTLNVPITVNNAVPDNATVEATSPDDAVGRATGNETNSSLGMGDWSVTLDVGAPLAGRIRPSGTISYTISVDVMYFEGNATRL